MARRTTASRPLGRPFRRQHFERCERYVWPTPPTPCWRVRLENCRPQRVATVPSQSLGSQSPPMGRRSVSHWAMVWYTHSRTLP
jgi:hypothetical protein